MIKSVFLHRKSQNFLRKYKGVAEIDRKHIIKAYFLHIKGQALIQYKPYKVMVYIDIKLLFRMIILIRHSYA